MKMFLLTAQEFKNPLILLIGITALLICLCFFWLSRLSKRKLNNLLLKDTLTGFPTKRKFCELLPLILKDAIPEEYSIISLDINNFHYVTDTFGQLTSDTVLQMLARHLRETFPEGSLYCRNYADNFYILIKASFRPILEDYVANATSLQPLLRDVLPEHYQLEFSVGVYVVTDTEEKPEIMLENANMARQLGKYGLNPKRISYYTEEMKTNTERDKDVTLDMNRAFKENEFEVFFQPKFNFKTGEVIGAEALIRWNHKQKGLLTPNYFVPLFERNGFIQKIDMLVFERVCQFLDRWNKSGKGGTCPHPITISCNLSRAQLYNPDIAKKYTEVARQYQIAPSKIEIELTESLMMGNKERLLRAMNEIKSAGFEISVDDFGSGFSSLSLLKDLPANVIKLDKEFLNTSDNNDKEQIIINSIIGMAKQLDITTVAEGVEDQAQSDLLKAMGCDIVQGYYYAKPMPTQEYESLLHTQLDK